MAMQQGVIWEYQSGSRASRCCAGDCGRVIAPGEMIYAVRDHQACEVAYHYCSAECAESDADVYDQWDEIEGEDQDEDEDDCRIDPDDLGCVDEEPQDGDLVLMDCGRMGSQTCVGIYGDDCMGVDAPLGAFDDEDEAIQACLRAMGVAQVWVSIWRQSDHGGLHLVSVNSRP